MATAGAGQGLSAQDFQCECCAKELDALYLLATATDAMVAKALVLSEVAQIAKLELRIQEALVAKWRNRTKQAESRAASMAAGGAKAPAIATAVERVMRKWPSDVERISRSAIEDIYRLARVAGWKKASGQTKRSLQYSGQELDKLAPVADVAKAKKKPKAALLPTFDLLDEEAIADLADDHMVWVGAHYSTNVRDTVRLTTSEVMSSGLGRIEAGRVMREKMADTLSIFRAPSGFKGPDKRYFEGLAANTATSARVRGQLRSFTDLGVTKYELVNPMDKRTSSICAHLNGKIFAVSDGNAQIDAVSSADDPDAVKAAHPWLTFEEIKRTSPKSGNAGAKDSAKLAKSGQALPPFHFKCRTTVDVIV